MNIGSLKSGVGKVQKQIADNTVGLVNRGTVSLLQLMDPQSRNQFEILLYPKSVEEGMTGMGFVSSALDTMMARLMIRSIDIPFMGVEYEQVNEIKVPKGIIYPDSISITLIEEELGTVRNYLNSWFKEIIFPVGETDATSKIARTNFVFCDNQEASKKNALIIPQSGLGLPTPGWIKIEGLKLSKIGNITMGHGEQEPMFITIECAVDNVWFKTLF